MKKIPLKRITAFLLAAAMLAFTSCSSETVTEDTTVSEEESIIAENYTDTTENVKKTETVYANLNADGSPRLVTVSDWLHADKSKVKISDTTTLKNFDVTKGYAYAAQDNGNITWQMASSDIYYEGSTDEELPVEISIKYYLDGNEITADELVGKSGKFKMEITLTNKVTAEVEINSETLTMYTPFVVAGGMMLSYDCFSEIEVENGITIGAGTYEIVALAGIPGINESLGLDALSISGFDGFSFSDTFTVSATVENFAMSDTYYIIAPLSSLNLDIDVPETLEDVRSILNEISSLETLLEQIDPDGQLIAFMSDSEKVAEMITIMKDGLNVYSENKAMLTTMSELMTPENIETLTNFINSLDSEQMQQITSLLSNVTMLESLLDSLLQLSTGLSDVMPIIESFSAALEDPEVAASLENLPETMEVISELADFMNENEEVLDILTELMTSDAFDSLTGMLDSILSESGEDIGSVDVSNLSGDAKTLVLKMSEWLQIDYPIFTSAPDYMETSCTFICKTDPIK